MARSFGMTFEGYWRDENEGGLPSLSGIYCVYICVDHPSTNEVRLEELIYIGEADDLKVSVAHHEKRPTWQAHLQPGQDLCYSFAHVAPADRQRCAAALIFQHQPRDNDRFRGTFPFEETTMSLDGRISHLHSNFTVQRAEAKLRPA